MHSPLHERLEYLVHYSSQLIFVSGDSVSHQQKTLEAFVFNQPDDTEIAYLTAQPGLTLTDYRRQLCQQLLGQLVGSYVQPLSQLLADLQQHAGPVLITITQSEHLPDDFLQELWDLVLDCRQNEHHQHVNVLLFGHSRWAANAKTWLPANNSQTPVLISSQSVMAQQVGSDLDTLINQRRQAFQARLDERAAGDASPPANRLRSPWVWATLLLVFIGCFGSLVGWQYQDQISQLFAPLDSSTASSTPPPKPGSAYQQLVDTPPSAGSTEAAKAAPGATSGTKAAEVIPSERVQQTPSIETSGADRRITSWQAAVAELNNNDSSRQSPTTAALASSQTEAAVPVQPAVPHIDVKLAQQLTAARASRLAERAQAAQITAQATTEAASTSVPGTDNQQLANLLTAQDYVIQLAGLKDLALLRQFVDEHKLGAQVWVYQTQRYGGNWFVLLFKQPFASLTAARQALALVPDFPGKDQAFVKSGKAVLSELQRSPGNTEL